MSKNEVVVPILNDEYKVIVCWGDSKQIRKVLKSYHHSLVDVEATLLNKRGICFYAHECHPVIALPQKPKTPQQIGTLAHESVHAIEDIFGKISQPIGGEVFAHCVGAIVRKVLSQ